MGQGVLSALLADAGLRDDPSLGLMMGEVPLQEIARQSGTPTYAYHAPVIRERFAALDAAFGDLPHRICYAVKANGNLAVLRVLAGMGAGADIVSGGELLRAIAAGFSPDRIVFSGVGKTDEELLAALTVGVGQINVESLAELRRLGLLAELQGVQATVGIRVNPDVTAVTHPYISTGTGGLKFGIPTDQFVDVLAILDQASHLTLGAIAMHLGSQITDPEPWVTGLERLLALLADARAAGHAPGTLDIGGGLGIRYHDESPLAPADWISPLLPMLRESGCAVQVEPGRYLVGAAGVLLTSVVHRKASGGREIAIVDAGMNDLLRPSLYRAWHEIVPVERTAGAIMATDIVGPVCETGDFLALGRPLAPVAAGGVLAVLGAGAYAFAMSSNYNSRARAAEVMVDGNRWAVVRPRERLVDLYRDEISDPFGHTEAP